MAVRGASARTGTSAACTNADAAARAGTNGLHDAEPVCELRDGRVRQWRLDFRAVDNAATGTGAGAGEQRRHLRNA